MTPDALVQQFVNGVIKREGGYVDNPSDKGGPTKYGITQATLSSWRQAAVSADDVRNLTAREAAQIYTHRYYQAPHYDRVAALSVPIAGKLMDIGVLSGTATATIMLQHALNALNLNGKLYPDLTGDGLVGDNTVSALQAYLDARNHQDGWQVLFEAISSLEGARFIHIAAADHSQEAFTFGWLRQRVYREDSAWLGRAGDRS